MTFRPATEADAEAIDVFLEGYADTSMFLRSNLRRHGPCGGEARNATSMWLRETGGVVSGVFGITTIGNVLVQTPALDAAGDARRELAGREINGIIGATPQVRAMQQGLGLATAATQLDDDEPLYSLDLDHLNLPDGTTSLRPADAGDRALTIAWRQIYLQETIHFAEADAAELAEVDIDGMLARGSLMMLERGDGTPVAMTSFNAILPDMVQIGNVFTPPEARGRGFARRAVALHLQVARENGVKRAMLFASGPAASRAYEAIGFGHIGSFTLLIFSAPQVVGGTGP